MPSPQLNLFLLHVLLSCSTGVMLCGVWQQESSEKVEFFKGRMKSALVPSLLSLFCTSLGYFISKQLYSKHGRRIIIEIMHCFNVIHANAHRNK